MEDISMWVEVMYSIILIRPMVSGKESPSTLAYKLDSQKTFGALFEAEREA